MVCDLEDTDYLNRYFDGFMLAPKEALGADTEPNWTVKWTHSTAQGNGAAIDSVTAPDNAALAL